MPANNRTQTGFQIVQRVLRAIGLPVPTSAAGATDTLSVQIWSLLTELGQELLNEHEWSFKTKTFTITTDGSLLYDLPDDFVRLIADTGWNNTSQIPVGGPISPQAWSYITARNLGTTVQLLWRQVNDQIEFFSVPSTPQTVQFQYISRGWVQDKDNAATFKDTMENDADICLYEPRLMVAMLRFRWRRAKGFNTTDLEMEYKRALENARNNDSPGQTLFLSGAPNFPYLGDQNIPDTGYGG